MSEFFHVKYIVIYAKINGKGEKLNYNFSDTEIVFEI